MQLYYCPHCGHSLSPPLRNGITGCTNCNRVFDCCSFNCLLSAAWLIRRQHVTDPFILEKIGCPAQEISLLTEYVIDKCYSHDEFRDFLLQTSLDLAG